MKKGDVVYIEADSWAKETDELIWTTSKETAEKHDMVEDGFEYCPKALIVGAGRLIKGLEESLLKAGMNKDYEFDIKPEDAYGKREAKLVEVVSMDQIRRLPEYREKDKDGNRKYPEVGDEFPFKGKIARITWMSRSRVRIDFNHPLAGKTIHYKYKIVKKPSKADEKIKAILNADFKKAEDFTIKMKEKSAEITLPDWCRYDQDWFSAKFKLVSDLREHANLEDIKFIEVFTKPKAKKSGKGKKEEGHEHDHEHDHGEEGKEDKKKDAEKGTETDTTKGVKKTPTKNAKKNEKPESKKTTKSKSTKSTPKKGDKKDAKKGDKKEAPKAKAKGSTKNKTGSKPSSKSGPKKSAGASKKK